MSTLALPNTIINGAAGDATKVQQNFDAIVADSNTNLIKKDGATQMTGALLLVAASPTLGEHATRKTYVDAQDTALDARTGAGASRVAVQAVSTSAQTFLLFDTEDWDPQAGFTATSSTITINTAGVYVISFHAEMSSLQTFGMDLFVNTIRRAGATGITDSAGVTAAASGSLILPLAAGATLQVMVWHTSGVNRNFTGGLAAARVSA